MEVTKENPKSDVGGASTSCSSAQLSKKPIEKSSSDGFLKLLKKTPPKKCEAGNSHDRDQVIIGCEGFSRGRKDSIDDKTNKAVRSAAGPLILIPQPKGEKEKKTPNKGIQYIPHQEAKVLIRDHKKLKEELLKDPVEKPVKGGRRKNTSARNSAPTKLGEVTVENSTGVTKSDAGNVFKTRDLHEDGVNRGSAKPSKDSKSNPEKNLEESSKTRIPYEKRVTDSNNVKENNIFTVDTNLSSSLNEGVDTTQTLGQKFKRFSFTRSYSHNEYEYSKGKEFELNSKDSKNLKKKTSLDPQLLSVNKTESSRRRKGDTDGLSKGTEVSAKPPSIPKTHRTPQQQEKRNQTLPRAHDELKNEKDKSINIRKYSNPSELSQKQKYIRENQERKLLDLHRKHLEEINKLRSEGPQRQNSYNELETSIIGESYVDNSNQNHLVRCKTVDLFTPRYTSSLSEQKTNYSKSLDRKYLKSPSLGIKTDQQYCGNKNNILNHDNNNAKGDITLAEDMIKGSNHQKTVLESIENVGEETFINNPSKIATESSVAGKERDSLNKHAIKSYSNTAGDENATNSVIPVTSRKLSLDSQPFSFSKYLINTKKETSKDKDDSSSHNKVVTEANTLSNANVSNILPLSKSSGSSKDKAPSLHPKIEDIAAPIDIHKKVHFHDEQKSSLDKQAFGQEDLESASFLAGVAHKAQDFYNTPTRVNLGGSILKQQSNSRNELPPATIEKEKPHLVTLEHKVLSQKHLESKPIKPPRGDRILKKQNSCSSLKDETKENKMEKKSSYLPANKPPPYQTPQPKTTNKLPQVEPPNSMQQSFHSYKTDDLLIQNKTQQQTQNPNTQLHQICQQESQTKSEVVKKVSPQQPQTTQIDRQTFLQHQNQMKEQKFGAPKQAPREELTQKNHSIKKEQDLVPNKKTAWADTLTDSKEDFERRPQNEENKGQHEGKEEEEEETAMTSPPKPPLRGVKQSTKKREDRNEVANTLSASKEGVLVCACRGGEEDQVLRLLRDLSKKKEFQAEFVNQTDKTGKTGLSYACNNGYSRVVEFLTSQPEIDLNLPDNEGNTPLHYAAQGGHADIVTHLVNTCSHQIDLDMRNNLGFTPLMKAALQGRTKIAKILLFGGASPNLRDYGRGYSAVEWAKFTGRLNCSDLIESVQRTCSDQIRDRWHSDPHFKSPPSTTKGTSSISLLHYDPRDGPQAHDSWIKHKIKKAFHKNDSKKDLVVVSNLSSLATCMSSPLVQCQITPVAKPTAIPQVQVTEVVVEDCYKEPAEEVKRSSSSKRRHSRVADGKFLPSSKY